MKTHTYQYYIISFLSLFILPLSSRYETPRLTVIFVIDQFPFRYLSYLKKHLHYGLHTLATNGLSFTNAHHPHGMTATCTGHTALNTGAYAKDHGIVGNAWYNKTGKKIACDTGDGYDDAVFSQDSLYTFGKSPEHIMVEGISDQFVLAGTPSQPHKALSVSLKSRAAIATANKLGKAFWFDESTGTFTSSQAYFDTLPAWLKIFNKKHGVTIPNTITWNQLYPDESNAYIHSHAQPYVHTRAPQLINTTISLTQKEKPYAQYQLTPIANKLILTLAEECIDTVFSKNKKTKLLLWVCISSLDKMGHMYGPESKEAIDMVYHLDKDIELFMQRIQKNVQPEDTLFVLTSDHGIPQIVEYLHNKGLNLGHRIKASSLKKELNSFIKEKYDLSNMVHGFKSHHAYIDTKALQTLSEEKQDELIDDIKTVLTKQKGITKIWTHEELHSRAFPAFSKEHFFQSQLFPKRSGHLIIQVAPYTVISDHMKGTSHKTPYTHNTHVPLIFYRKGHTQAKKMHQKVLTLQLAPTLAGLLEVSQPSAAHLDVLPGVIPE